MNDKPESAATAADDARSFAFVVGGMAVTLLAGLALSLLLSTPLGPQIAFTLEGVLLGVAATAPLAAFLAWFMASNLAAIKRFRESQIEFFSQIGFEFTPARIALMAAGAGITEELLFRGVLQTWAAGFMPVALAIVLPNILFGLLHARTTLYAVIAGVVGCYLGAVFHFSGNLLVPVIAHGLYDVVALELTRRAVKKLNA